MRVLLIPALIFTCVVSAKSLAGLDEWQTAVMAGTAPSSTYIADVDGPPVSWQQPVIWDVGSLDGPRSFEFIVYAGDAGGSGALMGFGGLQALKFEQWNDTGSLGVTNYGVADHTSAAPSPFNEWAQVVFVYDGADTLLYVNGELGHTFDGLALTGTDMQWLGAISSNFEVVAGAVYGDPLDGLIFGFASFGEALPAEEIAAHFNAYEQNNATISLAAWQGAVAAGTAPETTVFTPVSGLAPVMVDVGELAGEPCTFEFVVLAGEGGISQALLGRTGSAGAPVRQGLKFEQWNNTGLFGITNFGVTDISSDIPFVAGRVCHVAYVSDGLDTELYVDGEWQHTFFGTPLMLQGEIALGAAVTVAEPGFSYADRLDGEIFRFASYGEELSEEEIAAHYQAFAEDGGAYSFTQWLTAANAGTAPAALHLDPVRGEDGAVIDVGALADARTFEFIVNGGDGVGSSALLGLGGSGNQGLKFEQWNDTGVLGLTVYGVADHTSFTASPFYEDVHIVYASDGISTTNLYVNGGLEHTFDVPLNGTGPQGLGVAATIINAGGTAFFDRMDGHVLGFAAYAGALSAEELAGHAAALFGGGPPVPPAGDLRITSFSRNPATGELVLGWTSTTGRSYEINYSATLADFGAVVASGITATGALTTHTFAPPVAGAAQLYFRVKELPL